MDPPPEILTAIAHFYQSSLVSLFAAVFAMLAKECLNGYLLHGGGLAIDHVAGRRRKFDALVNPTWRFGLLVKTPDVLLRTALCFLILGLVHRLWVLSSTVIYLLSFFLVPGLVGYIGTAANMFQ